MIGTQNEGYLIQEKLGEGGMGTVYRALEVNLDRLVAIKVLNTDVARDPSVGERFRAEARAQAHLNHTNIATEAATAPGENHRLGRKPPSRRRGHIRIPPAPAPSFRARPAIRPVQPACSDASERRARREASERRASHGASRQGASRQRAYRTAIRNRGSSRTQAPPPPRARRTPLRRHPCMPR